MGEKNFFIKEALAFGWGLTRKNITFFIGILIVAGLFYLVPGIASDAMQDNLPFIALVTCLVGWVIQRALETGLITISLSFFDNEKGAFSDLLEKPPLVISYILSTIVYFVIILAGFLLLIIPGIIRCQAPVLRVLHCRQRTRSDRILKKELGSYEGYRAETFLVRHFNSANQCAWYASYICGVICVGTHYPDRVCICLPGELETSRDSIKPESGGRAEGLRPCESVRVA